MDPSARHLALVEVLRHEAREGVVPLVRLIEVALYWPNLGYYTSTNTRVGKLPGTDFTTAAALGPMFGELVASAAESFLGDLSTYTLVDIGAEPNQSHFSTVADRFAHCQTIRYGESMTFPPRAVCVANELLDAQPFHRLQFHQGRWVEIGVRVDREELSFVSLPSFSSARIAQWSEKLPPATEGWILDVPLAAGTILENLLSPGWSGMVMFFDYGKTLAQCLETSPVGTARAYVKHQLSGDILHHLGSQDLTCHVLWDQLEPLLKKHGFRDVGLERQEAFFVKYAGKEMERIAQGGDWESRGRLRALTHPAHFGSKFQVLFGIR